LEHVGARYLVHVIPRFLRSPVSQSSRLENVSVPNAAGRRCERRRYPRRPKASFASSRSRRANLAGDALQSPIGAAKVMQHGRVDRASAL
jgi:hypothetical protein